MENCNYRRDVSGLDELICNREQEEQSRKIVDCIVDSEKYLKNGVNLINRVLLLGVAGAGRRLYAECISKEAGVDYIYASAATFLDVDYAQHMDELFTKANESAPCVLLIEDIELIADSDKLEDNTSLLRLKEFIRRIGEQLDKKVFLFLSADGEASGGLSEMLTNEIGTSIFFGYPGDTQQVIYLKKLLSEKPVVQLEERDYYAILHLIRMYGDGRTSYARIKKYAEKALSDLVFAEIPIKDSRKFFLKAFERHMVGEGFKADPSTAFHEAGHAVLSWFFGDNLGVTIVSRGHYGGFSFAHVDVKDKKSLKQKIMVSMAGRAAESLFKGDASDMTFNFGAGSDFAKATHFAYVYFNEYALNEDHFTYIPNDRRHLYESVSDSMREEMWGKVEALLQETWGETVSCLKRYWDRVAALAVTLSYLGEVDAGIIEHVMRTGCPYVDDESKIRSRLTNMDTCNVDDYSLGVSGSGLAEFIYKTNDVIRKCFKEDGDRLSLPEKLDIVISIKLNLDHPLHFRLTLNEKINLLSNRTFVSACSGDLDDEIRSVYGENGECENEIPYENLTVLGKLELYLRKKINEAYQSGGKSDKITITKELLPSFAEKMFNLRTEDGFEWLLQLLLKLFPETSISAEHQWAYGCPVYPSLETFYSDNTEYDGFGEDAKLYYAVKAKDDVDIAENFNDAMRKIFSDFSRSSGYSCRVFEDREKAVEHILTLEYAISREGDRRMFEYVPDGYAWIEGKKRNAPGDRSLFLTMDFDAPELSELQDKNHDIWYNSIMSKLNDMALTLDPDINLYVLISFKCMNSDLRNKIISIMENYLSRRIV